MDINRRKQESAVLLPSLGWLLLSEKERQLLQVYVELALSRQIEDRQDKQDRLGRKATQEHEAELGKFSQLQQTA
jgi:hypothetical protein